MFAKASSTIAIAHKEWVRIKLRTEVVRHHLCTNSDEWYFKLCRRV